MHIHQKLCPGYKQWEVHSSLGLGGSGWEEDLQFITSCPICLLQLFNLVGPIYILGQPDHPEVIDQWPVLTYII